MNSSEFTPKNVEESRDRLVDWAKVVATAENEKGTDQKSGLLIQNEIAWIINLLAADEYKFEGYSLTKEERESYEQRMKQLYEIWGM
ncbi:hypothetical protein KBD71_01715 [Candidatus Woesebacteria bacterium]|nr:hypothetical protein [Candidatus Woesebacteria bacterium]